MADGFSDLEEKIMEILVKERKTAADVIAHASEIMGLQEEHQCILSKDADRNPCGKLAMICVDHNNEVIRERDAALLQLEEARKIISELRGVFPDRFSKWTDKNGVVQDPFGINEFLQGTSEKQIAEERGVRVEDFQKGSFTEKRIQEPPDPSHLRGSHGGIGNLPKE